MSRLFFVKHSRNIFFKLFLIFHMLDELDLFFLIFFFKAVFLRSFFHFICLSNFLDLAYLIFPPSHLILRKENHNVFHFFKVSVRTLTSTSFWNGRELSYVTHGFSTERFSSDEEVFFDKLSSFEINSLFYFR